MADTWATAGNVFMVTITERSATELEVLVEGVGDQYRSYRGVQAESMTLIDNAALYLFTLR